MPATQGSNLAERGEEQMESKPAVAQPRLSSDRLLQGARELLIEHQGELYRLRLTGKNKLILTK